MGKRVLCFGDSNTWGYVAEGGDGTYILRHPWSVRWPGSLQIELGDEWEILEEGLSGRTSAFDDPQADGRNGLRALREILPQRMPVDYVVLALGSNDLKKDVCGSAAVSAEALESLVEYIASVDASITTLILTTPAIGPGIFRPPFADEFGRPTIVAESEELARLQMRMATRRGLPYIESTKFACAGPDGLHLSAESQQNLGRAVADRLRKLTDSP